MVDGERGGDCVPARTENCRRAGGRGDEIVEGSSGGGGEIG